MARRGSASALLRSCFFWRCSLGPRRPCALATIIERGRRLSIRSDYGRGVRDAVRLERRPAAVDGDGDVPAPAALHRRERRAAALRALAVRVARRDVRTVELEEHPAHAGL